MKIKLLKRHGGYSAGTEHTVIGYVPHGGHTDESHQFQIHPDLWVLPSACTVIEDCSFYYFNPSGKWKYEGRGLFPVDDVAYGMEHSSIARANGGNMPGITSDGKCYDVVVIPDEHCVIRFAYPRMVKAVRHED